MRWPLAVASAAGAAAVLDLVKTPATLVPLSKLARKTSFLPL